MRNLRDQLEESLGDLYVIDRELGGGGMSRVFVARERALGRDVVVKVLPPGLTGVNVERFRREILVSARLQHPYIVPVHSAGEMEGMPYYTMPLVQGETLRDRLVREGALPLPDAVRILHDVADALAYAHEHGVVHRDIKPDNIILSRGHALVLDFGVAKALSAANVGSDDVQQTTGAGVAIGTPAYMAPEQAAGDPMLDHRSDIYAFGILAYETLVGESPFAGRAPHEMLAANITERPPQLGDVRAEVPPALSDLIARCLEKRPEDRPQGAAQIRQTLESVMTPSATTVQHPVPSPQPLQRESLTSRARRVPLPALAVAIVLVIAAAFVAISNDRAPELDEDLVAVMPFRIASADPALRYLGEGMVDLLAAKLDGTGGPRSADPRATFSAWQRAAGGENRDVPRDRALEIAERLGAGQMLIGSVAGASDNIILSATLVRVGDGRAQAQATVEGPVDSLARLVDELTIGLLAAGAGEAERLAQLTTTSLPALRAYLSGTSLYRRAHFRESVEHFHQAVQLDSSFALAGLGLTKAAQWFGDPAMQRLGLSIAHQWRDRLGPRDQAELTAIAGPSYPASSSALEMHAARVRYRDVAPGRAESWFHLGDSFFHFGPSLGIEDAHVQGAAAFRRAIALDSAFSPAMEHLVFLAARSGDTAQVRRIGELYLATDSLSEGATAVAWRMAVSLGRDEKVAEIVRNRAGVSPASAYTIVMMSQLDGLDMEVAEAFSRVSLERESARSERSAHITTAHDLAMNRGRPAAGLALTDEMAAVAASPRYHLRERLRDALYWDGDSAAAAAAADTLQRAIRSGPGTGERPAYGAHFADVCIVSLWHAADDNDGAVSEGLARLRDERAESYPTAVGCAIMLEAMQLARARDAASDRAIARLDSLLSTGPAGMVQEIGNLVLARLLESRGNLAGARAALRRREFFLTRVALLSTYLREQARLAELDGDPAEAAAAYRHYLALRSDPEPALRADAQWARERLMRSGFGVRGSGLGGVLP